MVVEMTAGVFLFIYLFITFRDTTMVEFFFFTLSYWPRYCTGSFVGHQPRVWQSADHGTTETVDQPRRPCSVH